MLGFPKAASDKVVRAILKEQPDISVEETVRMSLQTALNLQLHPETHTT